MGNMLTVRSLLLLFTPGEWWPALGIIPAALGIWAAVRAWKKDALVKALKENRMLRRENTKLEIESRIRIDELAYRDGQIDELTKIIAQQRLTASMLASSEHGRE